MVGASRITPCHCLLAFPCEAHDYGASLGFLHEGQIQGPCADDLWLQFTNTPQLGVNEAWLAGWPAGQTGGQAALICSFFFFFFAVGPLEWVGPASGPPSALCPALELLVAALSLPWNSNPGLNSEMGPRELAAAHSCSTPRNPAWSWGGTGLCRETQRS